MSRLDAPALALRQLSSANAPALQIVYEASADCFGQAAGESLLPNKPEAICRRLIAALPAKLV